MLFQTWRNFLLVYSYPFTLKLPEQTFSDKLTDKASQVYLQLKKQLIDAVSVLLTIYYEPKVIIVPYSDEATVQIIFVKSAWYEAWP
jgi:hypothetical protein